MRSAATESKGQHYKTLRICNLRKIDIVQSKQVSFLLSATNVLACKNTLAYYGYVDYKSVMFL
jgi:hypothetical protein